MQFLSLGLALLRRARSPIRANPRRIVMRIMMDAHRPDVWCSDRDVARQGRADAHKTCLAHPAGDATFALENSEDLLPMQLMMWLQKAFGVARDIDGHAVLAARRIAQLMPD